MLGLLRIHGFLVIYGEKYQKLNEPAFVVAFPGYLPQRVLAHP
jgi:hypothetical protein